ncbi:hypothetical protein [Streptomyces sp. NPDC003720]|uniref:hypothetical protein n=1 Tax=Streptomyces sp. NPDC003720 TaxID=3364684 RepID=UPI0036B5FFDE
MSEHPDQIRYARRFTIPQPDGDIHGVQFPSGLCLYDQPGIGLEAATSINHVHTTSPDPVVHWADEEQP